MHFRFVHLPCSLGVLDLVVILHCALRKPTQPVERHMWYGSEFPNSQAQLSSHPGSQLTANTYSATGASYLENILSISPLSPLLPDLSDLESSFLHFTFLPVRREIEQGDRT